MLHCRLSLQPPSHRHLLSWWKIFSFDSSLPLPALALVPLKDRWWFSPHSGDHASFAWHPECLQKPSRSQWWAESAFCARGRISCQQGSEHIHADPLETAAFVGWIRWSFCSHQTAWAAKIYPPATTAICTSHLHEYNLNITSGRTCLAWTIMQWLCASGKWLGWTKKSKSHEDGMRCQDAWRRMSDRADTAFCKVPRQTICLCFPVIHLLSPCTSDIFVTSILAGYQLMKGKNSLKSIKKLAKRIYKCARKKGTFGDPGLRPDRARL